MAITALLLASNGSEYVYNEIMDIVEAEEFIRISFEGVIQTLGEIFLCISAVLTVITGYIYFKVGFKNFSFNIHKGKDEEKTGRKMFHKYQRNTKRRAAL